MGVAACPDETLEGDLGFWQNIQRAETELKYVLLRQFYGTNGIQAVDM